jgi:flagellar hook assembly protein FlgD
VWGIKDANGRVVRGPARAGTLAKGYHTFTWDGLVNGGTHAANGVYTAYVSTSAVVSSTTLHGEAARNVRLDTVPPTLSMSNTGTSLYPYTDGFRDTITPKATTNEAGLLSLTVRNGSGAVVRTVYLSHPGGGTFTLTWNGRNSSGSIVPAGTYTYVIVSQDPALNRRASGLYSVVVSLKKLVGTAVATTVTPASSLYQTYIGSCSTIEATPEWSGGFEYLSDYYACGVYDGSDLAASEHRFTLPAAVKYAGISVAATGQEDLPGYGDTAAAFYLDTAGDTYGSGVVLGSSYGTRSLGSAPTTLLYNGRTLHWLAGTVNGAYSDSRSFTVRYTSSTLNCGDGRPPAPAARSPADPG